MRLALGIIATLVGSLLMLTAICVSAYIGAANSGNEYEQVLIAQLKNNENILAQYSQKVMEVAQVPEMYRDDVIKVVTASMAGRYGEKGSQATWQWLKEQNPTLDVSAYTKIQQIIESGRNEFQNAQTTLLDKKRVYQTQLGYLWTGFWLRTAGYPKIDLSKYDVVSNDYASEAFKGLKERGPIQLRKETK